MVLVMSIALFVTVTCFLYLFGMKFWVNPKTMLDRLKEGGEEAAPVHPSLAFMQILDGQGRQLGAGFTRGLDDGAATPLQRRLSIHGSAEIELIPLMSGS